MIIGGERSLIDIRSFIDEFSANFSDYLGEGALLVDSRKFRNTIVTASYDDLSASLFECCYFIAKLQNYSNFTLHLESNRGTVSFVFKIDKSFAEHKLKFQEIFRNLDEEREFTEEEDFFKIKISILNKKRQIKTMFVKSDDGSLIWNCYARRHVEKIDEWIEQINQQN